MIPQTLKYLGPSDYNLTLKESALVTLTCLLYLNPCILEHNLYHKITSVWLVERTLEASWCNTYPKLKSPQSPWKWSGTEHLRWKEDSFIHSILLLIHSLMWVFSLILSKSSTSVEFKFKRVITDSHFILGPIHRSS